MVTHHTERDKRRLDFFVNKKHETEYFKKLINRLDTAYNRPDTSSYYSFLDSRYEKLRRNVSEIETLRDYVKYKHYFDMLLKEAQSLDDLAAYAADKFT